MINRNDIKEFRCLNNRVKNSLKDGRIGAELFSDYPRLALADVNQLNNYVISCYGIHWPELDDDLSFDGFFR